VYRLKLKHLFFLILLLSGIIPLAISSFLLIRQNRDILETQEKSYLTRSAEFLSVELSSFLATARGSLSQLGETVVTVMPDEPVEARLRQPWLQRRVHRFLASNPRFRAVLLLDADGAGPQFTAGGLSPEVLSALRQTFRLTREEGRTAYRFVPKEQAGVPVAILAIPVAGDQEDELYVEAVVDLEPMESFFLDEAQGEVVVVLIDTAGGILWSEGSSPAMEEAIAGTDLVRDFSGLPLYSTAEYNLVVDGQERKMLGQISPVTEAGWGVVVQKPAAGAFAAVQQMVFKTALSTAVLVLLALVVAVVVAGRVSKPIQQLTETSHDIAAGDFGKRVEVAGPGAEIGQLATDFNRMSSHVESYVNRLQAAAQANRELFIGSMRAFVAAIDAKDPYTRGHSERVAAHSRTVARYLGLDPEMQHRVWVGALIHDVGKIGIEDAILKKGGVLSDAEYEQMKLHPVVGAQIMSRIEQLKEMIPAIRWHHEAWNGAGYPDGLEGEDIPLIARIVAIADTFDAITTNRPYQRAYEPAFAVQRIRQLAGRRFDAKIVTAFLRGFEAGEIQLRRSSPQPSGTPTQAAAAGATS
jgi:putative nucleotidyltransferase with HDIG domain